MWKLFLFFCCFFLIWYFISGQTVNFLMFQRSRIYMVWFRLILCLQYKLCNVIAKAIGYSTLCRLHVKSLNQSFPCSRFTVISWLFNKQSYICIPLVLERHSEWMSIPVGFKQQFTYCHLYHRMIVWIVTQPNQEVLCCSFLMPLGAGIFQTSKRGIKIPKFFDSHF